MSSVTSRRLRVVEVGRALLVAVNAVHLGAKTVARALPAEPGRVCVVMPDAGLAADPEVAAQLQKWVPMRYESIRLVAAGAGAPGSGPAPAQVLCDMLDAEVLAPDGDLAAVPGGSLFVLPGPDGSSRGWWRFRPGRPPQAGGRRYPVPEWERALFGAGEIAGGELMVEEIPAGLWVHWADRWSSRTDELAYAIPAQPDTVALLVSRPGDRPLRAADLRRLVSTLPERVQERLVVIPYGDRPVADGQLGAVVSGALNRTVKMITGLPLRLAGRGHQVTVVDADGDPAWMPFAREVSWRPHAGSRILSYLAPAERLLPTGPAQFLLTERWVVEIIEAGLWIHEVDRTDGATVVRQLPLDARHCTVVVGACGPAAQSVPWRAVRNLLKALPAPARGRVRLAVPAAAGEWFLNAVTRRCQRVLRGRPVAVLTPGGELRFAGARRLGRRAEPERGLALRQRSSRRRVASSPSPSDDLSRLLGFVDEIRRTPAWDERPDTEVVSVPFAAPEPEVSVPAAPVGPPAYPAGAPAYPEPANPVDAPRYPPAPSTTRPYAPPQPAGSPRAASQLASPAELADLGQQQVSPARHRDSVA